MSRAGSTVHKRTIIALFLVAALSAGCGSSERAAPEPVQILIDAPGKARDAAESATQKTEELQKDILPIEE